MIHTPYTLIAYRRQLLVDAAFERRRAISEVWSALGRHLLARPAAARR
jgi:hypothetical protein